MSALGRQQKSRTCTLVAINGFVYGVDGEVELVFGWSNILFYLSNYPFYRPKVYYILKSKSSLGAGAVRSWFGRGFSN